MSLYLDASALLKLYIAEADSDACEALLDAEPVWVTAEHTYVEIRRNLARLLDRTALAEAREDFAADWTRVNVVPVDATLCEAAATLAETTGLKTLDALHLAAAQLGEVDAIATFDGRLASAARSIGVAVAELPR